MASQSELSLPDNSIAGIDRRGFSPQDTIFPKSIKPQSGILPGVWERGGGSSWSIPLGLHNLSDAQRRVIEKYSRINISDMTVEDFRGLTSNDPFQGAIVCTPDKGSEIRQAISNTVSNIFAAAGHTGRMMQGLDRDDVETEKVNLARMFRSKKEPKDTEEDDYIPF